MTHSSSHDAMVKFWWYSLWLALALATLLLLAPRLAAAEEAKGDPGQRLYLRYCSACHGTVGKGDGVVSQFMNPKPTDLTIIAKNNGGNFPTAQVAKIIDGTDSRRAHGDSDMPVWGEVFREEAGSSHETAAAIRGKVQLIAEYIHSIQAK